MNNHQVSSRALHHLLSQSTLYNIQSSKPSSRLSKIGFDVGYKSTILLSNTQSLPYPPQNSLDVLKFLCSKVWLLLFGKQIDNLRTNHSGTYVIIDNNPLAYSGIIPINESSPHTNTFLEFHIGIIEGVLQCLGVEIIDVTVNNNNQVGDDDYALEDKISFTIKISE